MYTCVDNNFNLCCNIVIAVLKKGDSNMTTKTKKNVESLEKSLEASNVVETLDQLESLIS